MMRFGGEDLKVYLYRDPVDMRKGRNCLAALAQEVMKVDPFSGALVILRVSKILCARHSMRTWRSYATYQEEPGG